MKEINFIEDLYVVKKPQDLKDDGIGALLTIEGAGAISSISDLEEVYAMGIRLITLTWNWINKVGYPNIPTENMDKGLTEFGIKIVKRIKINHTFTCVLKVN